MKLYSRFRMCLTTQNAPAAFKQIIFACGTSVTKLLVPDKRSHLSVQCLRAAMKKGKPSLKFTRTDMLQLHIAQPILVRTEIEKKAVALSLCKCCFVPLTPHHYLHNSKPTACLSREYSSHGQMYLPIQLVQPVRLGLVFAYTKKC